LVPKKNLIENKFKKGRAAKRKSMKMKPHSSVTSFRGGRRRRRNYPPGSVVGLQLRVRFVPAALLAVLRTALALQCVSKARDWTGHVDR
jgi:hypothetical protein